VHVGVLSLGRCMPTTFDVCHAEAAATDGAALGNHRACMLPPLSLFLCLHRHLHGVPSRRDTVYIDTYMVSPRGGTPSTSTPTRSPLVAVHRLHRHLHGIPSRRGTVYIDTYTESPHDGVPSTQTYTESPEAGRGIRPPRGGEHLQCMHWSSSPGSS
jgi:hypothetical protein